jgi:glucokinase
MMSAVRQATMSALNEALVLDYVRDRGDTSRPDVARDLGLSPATVSRIVSRLVRGGLVTEASGPSDGRGRPAGRLAFNNRAGCVLAIDLGGTKCHGVLADLSGGVLVEDVRPTGSDGSPYDTLVATISALVADAPTQLVAAAVGIPAIVDARTGVAIEGPNVLWRDFAIVDALKGSLRVPFAVDNDVKLAALAQAWRGPGRGVKDFATISIGTGIGAAIVANGELLRGGSNAAGEVGYLIIDRQQLTERRADWLGGLERRISGPAIAGRARELLLAHPAEAGGLEPSTISSEEILAAALEGHPLASRLVDEVLETLLVALIALTVTTDPAVIILDGGVGRSLEPYLERLSAALAEQLPWSPRLDVSRLGPNATVVGAIATALWLDRQRRVPQLPRRTFGAPTVRAHVG